MTEEKSTNGDLKAQHTTATNEESSVKMKERHNTRKNKQKNTKTVPYYKLYSFADTMDYLLMFVGTVSAVGNGFCMPIMAIIFGSLVNSFGDNGNNRETVHKVSKVPFELILCLVSKLGSKFTFKSYFGCFLFLMFSLNYSTSSRHNVL